MPGASGLRRQPGEEERGRTVGVLIGEAREAEAVRRARWAVRAGVGDLRLPNRPDLILALEVSSQFCSGFAARLLLQVDAPPPSPNDLLLCSAPEVFVSVQSHRRPPVSLARTRNRSTFSSSSPWPVEVESPNDGSICTITESTTGRSIAVLQKHRSRSPSSTNANRSAHEPSPRSYLANCSFGSAEAASRLTREHRPRMIWSEKKVSLKGAWLGVAENSWFQAFEVVVTGKEAVPVSPFAASKRWHRREDVRWSDARRRKCRSERKPKRGRWRLSWRGLVREREKGEGNDRGKNVKKRGVVGEGERKSRRKCLYNSWVNGSIW